MALKKTVETQFGTKIVDAYHRVENLRIVEKNKIAYQVNIYADIQFKPIDNSIYESVYAIEGTNPIAQAYQHLKTLPEFDDAKDC